MNKKENRDNVIIDQPFLNTSNVLLNFTEMEKKLTLVRKIRLLQFCIFAYVYSIILVINIWHYIAVFETRNKKLKKKYTIEKRINIGLVTATVTDWFDHTDVENIGK